MRVKMFNKKRTPSKWPLSRLFEDKNCLSSLKGLFQCHTVSRNKKYFQKVPHLNLATLFIGERVFRRTVLLTLGFTPTPEAYAIALTSLIDKSWCLRV